MLQIIIIIINEVTYIVVFLHDISVYFVSFPLPPYFFIGAYFVICVWALNLVV
jgi:hypothetical protein